MRKSDRELLSEVVSAIGLLYGLLETIRERLTEDDSHKWRNIITTITLTLESIDQLRKDF